MLAQQNFSWSEIKKPAKTIDLNKFFENTAYQNLFSELKTNNGRQGDDDQDEDDISTNAPESRTISSINPVTQYTVKVNVSRKKVKINGEIGKMLKDAVSMDFMERFKEIKDF